MDFKFDLDDSRDGIRLDFKLPVEVSCAEAGNKLFGIMINLSVHGMLVKLEDELIDLKLKGNGDCTVRVVFPGKGSRLMIDQLRSTVVRKENNMLGIKFKEPLEWFLLFNVYKARQLDQELL